MGNNFYDRKQSNKGTLCRDRWFESVFGDGHFTYACQYHFKVFIKSDLQKLGLFCHTLFHRFTRITKYEFFI